MRLLEQLKGWWLAIWLKRPSERVRPKPPSPELKVWDPPIFKDKYQEQFDKDPEFARFDRDIKRVVQNIRDGYVEFKDKGEG
jgi:hypothetical protein